MANKALNNAKRAKKDEFYTRREDIGRELTHYAEHFRGKTVYCNCDDPVTSEFWRFFARNFWAYGLKKLMATHYEPDEKNFSYKLELTEMANGQLSYEGAVKTQIPCNGDFRSAACIDLLKEADIVVTNPPFSLFREYVAQLMEYGKKFVIIGSLNAITYREIFPLLQNNQIWLGYGFAHGDAFFWIPPENAGNYAKGVYNAETGLVHFRNCTWFTNLDIPKRHEGLDLRGNHYNPEKNPFYDNYDAIEVSKKNDIPEDYDGAMGVPITFFSDYCPEQFQIIGATESEGKGFSGNLWHQESGVAQAMIRGKRVYKRIFIRRI